MVKTGAPNFNFYGTSMLQALTKDGMINGLASTF